MKYKLRIGINNPEKIEGNPNNQVFFRIEDEYGNYIGDSFSLSVLLENIKLSLFSVALSSIDDDDGQGEHQSYYLYPKDGRNHSIELYKVYKKPLINGDIISAHKYLPSTYRFNELILETNYIPNTFQKSR